MKALPKILLALTAVAALSVAYPAKANLITNGGFETGNFTGWTADFNGIVLGTSGGVAPHSGNFQAAFSNISSLTQSVATTPGASYTINFFLALASVRPNSFSVSWGGVPIFSLTNQANFGYTFNVTASTAFTALLFNFFCDSRAKRMVSGRRQR
jgi:hypothetical protein